MREVKVVADTSCELRPESAAELGVEIVPFKITLDGVNYIRDIDITIEEFYKRIAEKGVTPKTSLPSPGDYFEVFERIVKEGKDIICLCLSSGFSGSYQSAVTASEEIAEKYPEAKIYVIDTKSVTWVMWSMVFDTVELLKQGKDAAKIAEALKTIHKGIIGTLTVDSLEHLIRGGRVSRAAGIVGNVLDVKPVLQLVDGSLVPRHKIRGRKKTIARMVEYLTEGLKDKNLDDYRFFAMYCGMKEYGQDIQRLMSEKLGIPESEIGLGVVGTVLGCHGGPTVSIAGCIPKLKV